MDGLVATGALAAVLGASGWWWWRGRAPVPAAPVSMRSRDVADAAVVDEGVELPEDWIGALLELALGKDRGESSSAHAEAVVAAERSLERFVSEPQRLPRRPQLLPQLLGALNDDTSSASRIAALVGRDPALAANLLKLANSALYRVYPAPVESLERAVALVGMQGMRQLVALALMQPVMRVEGGVLGRLPDVIWEHTQYATLAARDHAGRVGGVDVFSAQLLVLLQALGAIVVVQALRDAYDQRGLHVPSQPGIAELLQRWAPRIGRLVAQTWELPARSWQALEELERPEADGDLATVLRAAGPAGIAALRAMKAADPTQAPALAAATA